MQADREGKTVLAVIAVAIALLVGAPAALGQGFTDYGTAAADQYGSVPTPTPTPTPTATTSTDDDDQGTEGEETSGGDDDEGGSGSGCPKGDMTARATAKAAACPGDPGGDEEGDDPAGTSGPGGAAGTPQGSGLPLRDATGALPFTGFDLGLLALLGVLLVAAGAALRLAARTRAARRAA